MLGEGTRGADELATLIYTSGTTGKPKGVMHNFGNFAWALDAGIKRITMSAEDRMLSYLPLAHVVERVLVEHGWLRTGDKGQIDAQGRLHITGRVKDLFKTSKGKYVAAAPIEDTLVMH